MNHGILVAAIVSCSALPCAIGAPAPAPTTRPASTQPADSAAAGAISLRELRAVMDAHERRQDWHTAAEQATQKVTDESLRSQLIQRLTGLVPHVAKELVAHPQENALVTIAVYKQAASEQKQAMVSVTFAGLGNTLTPDTFGAILADFPKPPAGKNIPADCVLDKDASSYLVLFLGKKGIEGDDIPHEAMKQSIALAARHKEEVQDERQQAVARSEANEERAVVAQQERAQAQQVAASESGSASASPPVIPEVVNDGYTYPGVGYPIIILGQPGVGATGTQGDGRPKTPQTPQVGVGAPPATEPPRNNSSRPTFPGPGQPGGAPARGGNSAPPAHK